MDSLLIESLNISLSNFLLVTLTTLLPGSTEGLMGLREGQTVTPLSSKGLDVIWMKVPRSNGSGSLSHSTAHQMRDVAPNRWRER